MKEFNKKTPSQASNKPTGTKKNNEKTIPYSSSNKAPVPKKNKKRKPKSERRRKGIIIASVTDESLSVFLEAQEKVMRRIAHQKNVNVVEVYRVIGNILDSKKLVDQIKELVGINEYEVILAQSRYRLSSNICDVLDFEIFIVEHGAQIIYL